MQIKKIWKYFLWIILGSVFLLLTVIYSSERLINSYEGKTYAPEEITEISQYKTALLLGTSKYVVGGSENLYYRHRVEAAYELWKNDKIRNILVSGDSSRYYNEPHTFKNDLIELGIPDSLIYLDQSGFRTFDSVVRARRAFHQDSVLIISQEFHNLRALFIADKIGLFAEAYNAEAVEGKRAFTTELRERFARVKAIMDIYLLNTEPQDLGNAVKIRS